MIIFDVWILRQYHAQDQTLSSNCTKRQRGLDVESDLQMSRASLLLILNSYESRVDDGVPLREQSRVIQIAKVLYVNWQNES